MRDVKVDAGRSRPTQHERRAATRAALLSAAADAIVDTGPAASMADIARRASVSTGALQHHFASKTDLLVEVVRVGWDDLFDRSLLVDRGAPAAQRVEALVWAVWDSYRQPKCRAAFLVSFDPSINHDVAGGIVSVFEDVRVRLDHLWHEVFADLQLPIERVAMARRFTRSHLAGMVVQRHMATVEPPPDDELDLVIQATLGILTAPDA